MPMTRRTLGLGAAALCAAVIVVLAVSLLPARLQTGVSGAATLALVLVTAWYVRLTSDLVAAQRATLEQNRLSEEKRTVERRADLNRQAVVEVWRICMNDPVHWDGIRREMAAIESTEEWAVVESAIQNIYEQVEQAREFAISIVNHALDSPPAIESAIWNAATLSTRAFTIGAALAIARHEVSSESRADNQPTKKRLSEIWTVNYRPSADGLEWSDLISGAFATEAESAIGELEGRASRYAQGRDVPKARSS